MKFFITFLLIPCLLLPAGCNQDEDSAVLFTKLASNETGVHFKNILVENESANVLNYTYFYNGGGVAIGDINNDGLPDILFTGNMVPNRLYLNKGNFKFEDITEKSGISKMQGWCTGATMADVNGDGKLDIYICRSADADPQRRKNLLFINNGDLTFTEKAEEYGLADEGYSTQASFFDYDKDGDLDMILINHSLKEYASNSYENAKLHTTVDPSYAVKLYRNDNGHFTEVSHQAGINSNVLTFGLSVDVSDINNDGWPDIYISNDFNEPDYLFINNHDGTFSEKLKECMDQVSLYSMGSDCADYNNDGFTDLITLDMLGEDNHSQKMHSGAENFDKFQQMFKHGFYYQYSRNMLQTNNGDGTFCETGQLAGISNTDWSWSALFCDFDNDGYKDLFITNGYAKDFTDMDFIKFQLTHRRNSSSTDPLKDVLDKMPPITLPNYIFHNDGNGSFTKKTDEWGFAGNTISSGAAYADLNNDGAMDLIISNINGEAVIYKNNAAKMRPTNNYLKIKLNGSPKNTFGIGAKVKAYCGKDLYFQEEMPVRGFQSSVDPVLNFGLGKNRTVDSIIIIWPDDKMQKIRNIKSNQTLLVNWKQADSIWHDSSSIPQNKIFTPVKAPCFIHKENEFNDFSVQALMPNYLSRQGPCLVKADVNKDGREDFFIGGAKGQPSAIFIQNKDGEFLNKKELDIASDSSGEIVAAEFFDADGDGNIDLYIAKGGYEFSENDIALQDHLYLNDGKGNFRNAFDALPEMRFSKGCVKAADIDGNGSMDLFVGGRVVPGKYPIAPESKILLNDGKGHFRDATAEVCPALRHIGMVTDALWIDLDGDDTKDLIIVGEFMPIKVFINHNGKLVDASEQYIKFPSAGLWNKILAADFDNDGDLDLVIGNEGTNTQFKVKEEQPMTLYYKDFDNNGTIDPVLCYYIDGVSYPSASRDDITDQVPSLRKKFIQYHAYADATITDLFTPEQLKDAGFLRAEIMKTIFLENRGKNGFVLKELPREAQYAPVYAMAAEDINHDGKMDVILTGNNSWTRIKFGRYRANHGVVLLGDGNNNFSYVPQRQTGLNIREDIRSVCVVKSGNSKEIFFGANDSPLKAYWIK